MKYVGLDGRRYETREEAFWETRYRLGDDSGIGSAEEERDWKWKKITEFAPRISSVIDVGCGDLRFWKDEPDRYVGIDISKTIIERNRMIPRMNWKFICAPAEKRIDGLKAPFVFCIDLLFHIMDDDRYEAILENLCYYSSRFIIIHTWINNFFGDRDRGPFTDPDGQYMTFRRFEDYFPIFDRRGFSNPQIRRNPNGIGALYFFQKLVELTRVEVVEEKGLEFGKV